MSQFGRYVTPRQKNVNRDNYNELTSYIRGTQAQPRQNENAPRDYDLVKVENGSGYDQDPLSILRIHDATWDEREDQDFTNEGMRNGVESLGVKPSDEWNQVAVLQKSAPEDWFQQGVCSGPTPVFVLFPSEESLDYPFAIPIPEDSTKLIASPYGLNRILWHKEPSEEFEECTGETLQAYVNFGEDGQWVWWKLEEDLDCCGSATAKLCDECGTVLQPDCPIEREIYSPKSFDVCECEGECKGYKEGDVVPAWWYQYLEKWITIPNYHPNFQKKEQEVVTGLQITGGKIVPGTEHQNVVTGIVFHPEVLALTDYEAEEVTCTGTISLGDDAGAIVGTGDITVSGTISDVSLTVVSASTEGDSILITGASLSSSTDLELSGEMETTATVNVPLDGVSLDVTGWCEGTASGPITVSGGVKIAGPLVLTGTLPKAQVTGLVTVVDQHLPLRATADLTGKKNVTLSGGTEKTFTKITEHELPELKLETLSIPALNGSVSGTLSYETTESISLSGITATIDLSSVFQAVRVVDPDSFSFSGCTLNWTEKTIYAATSLEALRNISVSLSGDVLIPSKVKGTSNHDAQSGTHQGVTKWSAGKLSKDDVTVTVPDTATIDADSLDVNGYAVLNGAWEVDGTASWEEGVTFPGASIQSGSISLSGNASLPISGGSIHGTASGAAGSTVSGTATVSAPVTVSGPLDLASGVTITGTMTNSTPHYAQGSISGVSLSNPESFALDVIGSIEDNRTCTVQVPTGVEVKEEEETEPIVMVLTPMVVPTVDLTGATISTQTTTIKYINCECDDEDSDSDSDSSSGGSNA